MLTGHRASFLNFEQFEYASATMHVSCIHVCAVSVLVVLIDRYVISILKI